MTIPFRNKRPKTNQQGFGLVSVLIIIVVVLAVSGAGAYALHKEHDKTKVAATSNKSTAGSSDTTTLNPYAGWKTYCDSTYHYCFKYPANWQASVVSNTTNSPGGEGGVSLSSPTNTVQVSYENAFVKDSSSIDFVASTITKLTTANQSLDLIGGYNPSSGDNGLAGNNIPLYEIVDSSFLDNYPIAVGQSDQFPSNPNFSDQYAADSGYQGSFMSKPSVTINTVAQAQSWLKSADAQTSAQILQSLYYEKP